MDNMFDFSRDQYLMLITDGIQPIAEQSPCDVETGEPQVDLRGTDFIVVGVGTEWQEEASPETFTCLTDQITVMEDWQELAAATGLNAFVVAEECGSGTGFGSFTLFDGEYESTGNLINDKPSYFSDDGKLMYLMIF